MNSPGGIYWDVSAWIELSNLESPRRSELLSVYREAKSGLYNLVTSIISIPQCWHSPSEHNSPTPLSEENEQKINELFNQEFVVIVQLSMPVALHARSLSRQYTELRKFEDAIHVASAIHSNSPILHTYDRDHLLRLHNRLRCRNKKTIEIIEPAPVLFNPVR